MGKPSPRDPLRKFPHDFKGLSRAIGLLETLRVDLHRHGRESPESSKHRIEELRRINALLAKIAERAPWDDLDALLYETDDSNLTWAVDALLPVLHAIKETAGNAWAMRAIILANEETKSHLGALRPYLEAIELMKDDSLSVAEHPMVARLTEALTTPVLKLGDELFSGVDVLADHGPVRAAEEVVRFIAGVSRTTVRAARKRAESRSSRSVHSTLTDWT